MKWLTVQIESRDRSYRERVQMVGNSLTIGRDQDCDLTVGHSTVSGVHARIILSRRRFRVEDSDSRNGLILNRIPISSAGVHAGDILTLGQGGPEVRLIELDAGPAILPRILLSLLVLLLTAGGVAALRLKTVELWLTQARLWLPEYEEARWFAADVPETSPEPEPDGSEDPVGRDGETIPRPHGSGIRRLPNAPTHLGNGRRPGQLPSAQPIFKPPPPLADGTGLLPGSPGNNAREALARIELDPPDLRGSKPILSSRYLFAGVRRRASTAEVNQALKKSKAHVRASFPESNVILVEIPGDGRAVGALREAGSFGLLFAAMEGAPGGADAKTQAAAISALVASLDPSAGRDLDIQTPRTAVSGEKILVVYELIATAASRDIDEETEETRVLILDRREGRLFPTRDLEIDDLSEDLKVAVEPIRKPPQGRGE